MKKKIIALALVFAMLFSLVACGGADDEGVISSKEGVFKVEDIEQRFGAGEEDYLGLTQMKVVDGVVYMVVDISYTNGSTTKFISMDLKGNIKDELILNEQTYQRVDAKAEAATLELAAPMLDATAEVITDEVIMDEAPVEDGYTASSYISSYQILDDGRIAYIKTTDVADYEMDEYYNKNEFIVVDIKGENELKVLLEGLPEENNYFYANCMIPEGEEEMYLLSYEHAFRVNLVEGTAEYFMPAENVQNVYSVAFYKDGKPVVGLWDEDYTKQTYSAIDIATGEVLEEVDIPESFTNFTFIEGGKSGYDLLLANNNAVYGYNLGDEDKELVMHYLNSDLATYSLRNVSFVDEDTFYAMYNDIVDYEVHFAKFTKIPTSQVPNKQNIVVAASSVDNEMKKQVIEFNKTNDKYRIAIKDYSEYNSYEDYTAGDKQMDMDIVSGLVPDVIVCDSNFSMAKYADKEMFVDFYELLESDDTLSKEDFAENVLRAYEVGGKLYQLPISFHVMTIMGKTSIFGNDFSLTWDEIDAIMEQYPDAKLFTEMTREDILTYGLLFNYGQLVDEVTGECHFESDTFKNLLEFAKTYPEEINWEDMYSDDLFWMDMESQYIEDRVLLTLQNVYSLYDGWMQGYRTFAEDATPVGFPTVSGNGSRIESPLSFAIYSDSDVKDGAWEFVKGFLSEEAQMPTEKNPHYSATGRLPVLKKALEECAKGITTKPSYIGTDGNRVEYDEYIYINNEQVLVEPGTEEDAKMWLDYVLSIDQKTSGNYTEALAIITEDAAGFFDGAKSVDEVASVIQSRMTILVNEDR